MTILANAKVVLPDREETNSSLLIDGDRIKAINTSGHFPGDEQIDLSNCVVFPGFIDVHNHGSVGIDVMVASEAELREVSHYLVSQGVTSWLPTLVPSSDDDYARVAHTIDRAMQNSTGARVLGIHYEGPFVNTVQCGALHQDYFKTYLRSNDLDLLHTPTEGAKMITLAPEVNGGIELVRELNDRGWVISIGHTRAEIETLNRAFAAGARHLTHFMNAMLPLHHRNPGPIAWALSEDEVTFDLIADGIHLDPLILKMLVKLKDSRCITLISDSIAAAGKGDGDYQIWGETISVKDGRTSNKSGSIAGSVISMLDAVVMMRSLGVGDVEIGKMAASNPAKLLRVDGECGSIEVGKRADLTAVTDDGQVRLTMVGGEVVFRK